MDQNEVCLGFGPSRRSSISILSFLGHVHSHALASFIPHRKVRGKVKIAAKYSDILMGRSPTRL